MDTKTATIKKTTAFVGKGCAVQLLGIVLFVFSFALGPVGIVGGLILAAILFIYGSAASRLLTCSNCGTHLLNKTIRECPGCHASFTK